MDAKLNLSLRDRFGSKAKTLVEDGNVLGNIYGKGVDSIAVYGKQQIVEKVVSQAGKNHPIDITLDDGKELMALVHDIERDNLTRKLHHVTFQVVKKGEKVTTEVPIHQVGDAPAARTGMIIVTLMDHVEVEAIPSNIPEELTVSIESLVEDGDQVTLADVVIPADVELKAELDMPIAKVDRPRAQVEDEKEESEEVGAADVPSEHGTEKETTE